MTDFAAIPRVRLYTKPNCHLCDIAKERIASVRQSEAFELEIVDITSDPGLFARYGERIPVVFVEDEEVSVFRVSEKKLARKLRERKKQGFLSGVFRFLRAD